MGDLAVGSNSLLRSWDVQFGMPFHRVFSFFREVINKLLSPFGMEMILLAPWWPLREWFSFSTACLLLPPRLLSFWTDLLCQPLGEVFLGNLSLLALTAWRLSSGSFVF